jgi:phosphatidylglycerol---prolipoprotein diacylglyceryl transferase
MWPSTLDINLPFWPNHLEIRIHALLLMIGFLGGTWWAARRARRVKASPDLIVSLSFVALVFSLVGARTFYVIHYWDEHFKGRGLWAVANLTAGGMEFYGGFIGAFLACTLFLLYRRVSFRLYADLLAPSLALGLGVTRIGCFINGCCWGGPCPSETPWAVKFPYLSPAFQRQWQDRIKAIPAELIFVGHRGEAWPFDPGEATGGKITPELASYARTYGTTPKHLAELARSPNQRSVSVHPVQLYASINAFLLALVLNAYFYRRKRHGVVFGLFAVMYALTRIVEEVIRADNPHDMAGLTASQFVSLILLLAGVAYLIYLRRLPSRSPRAVPWVPAAA